MAGSAAAGECVSMRFWRLVSEPLVVALSGLADHAQRFAASGKALKIVSVVLTVVLATVLPIGLVVTSMVPLSYTTGHPLARVAWDLGLVVLMAEVVQVLPIILIPLSILSVHSFLADTVERTVYYAQEEEVCQV